MSYRPRIHIADTHQAERAQLIGEITGILGTNAFKEIRRGLGDDISQDNALLKSISAMVGTIAGSNGRHEVAVQLAITLKAYNGNYEAKISIVDAIAKRGVLHSHDHSLADIAKTLETLRGPEIVAVVNNHKGDGENKSELAGMIFHILVEYSGQTIPIKYYNEMMGFLAKDFTKPWMRMFGDGDVVFMFRAAEAIATSAAILKDPAIEKQLVELMLKYEAMPGVVTQIEDCLERGVRAYRGTRMHMESVMRQDSREYIEDTVNWFFAKTVERIKLVAEEGSGIMMSYSDAPVLAATIYHACVRLIDSSEEGGSFEGRFWKLAEIMTDPQLSNTLRALIGTFDSQERYMEIAAGIAQEFALKKADSHMEAITFDAVDKLLTVIVAYKDNPNVVANCANAMNVELCEKCAGRLAAFADLMSEAKVAETINAFRGDEKIFDAVSVYVTTMALGCTYNGLFSNSVFYDSLTALGNLREEPNTAYRIAKSGMARINNLIDVKVATETVVHGQKPHLN